MIDFGNLLSIESVVRASHALPMSPVAQSGPLGYHWLYFAFPAWSSEFLGLPGHGANALILANLVNGSLFYLVLSHACARVLKATGDGDPARRAARLAGLALFAISTLYAYQAAVGVLHRSWFTLGTRNQLLLQLPHSMACFGNNTLALILCLLIIDTLGRWISSGNRGFLGFAAACASLLPGYSIMLVFPMGLAIVIWTLSGRARRPVLTLSVFGVFAAAALVIFRAIGLFSYGGGGGHVILSFDRGQFIQNVVLGFFPATFAVGIWVWTNRRREVLPSLFPFLCLALACLAIPTVSMTKGSPTSPVDFSIKTASLYLVATTPFFAIAAAWLGARLRQHRVLGLAGIALVGAGLVNSGAYVLQHAFNRALHRDGVVQSISLDHYQALELVAREPSAAIVIDQFSIPNTVTDPAVMLGGKRVLVGSKYDEIAFPPSAAAKENNALWLGWQSGGFTDEALGRQLAERADLLIAEPEIRSASWQAVGTFEHAAVYRSVPRGGNGAL